MNQTFRQRSRLAIEAERRERGFHSVDYMVGAAGIAGSVVILVLSLAGWL